MNEWMVSIPKITYLQDRNEILALCDSLNITDPVVRDADMLMVSSQDGEIDVRVCEVVGEQDWQALLA